MFTEAEKEVIADSLILLERMVHEWVTNEEVHDIVQIGPLDGTSGNYASADYLAIIGDIRAKLGVR